MNERANLTVIVTTFLTALLVPVVNGHYAIRDPLADVEGSNVLCLMSEGHYTCKDHSRCLPFANVCDKKLDCKDGSDEAGSCAEVCRKGRCSYRCQVTPLGPYCWCPMGFQLQADNTTCSDVDECSQWPPACDQVCKNSVGSFTCSCVAGYTLHDDQIHCHVTSGQAFIVYTQGSSIFKIVFQHGTLSAPSIVYRERSPIYSFALDSVEERIFWFCAEDLDIKSIGLTDSSGRNNVKRVVTNGLERVSTMAYDWMGKNLYFADSVLHKIFACSVANDICITIFTEDKLDIPRSIAVDPIQGKLYWSECGSSRKIEVSSMDGTNVRPLVSSQMNCARSLYVDLPANTLYWTDPELYMIESVVTTGQNRKNLTSMYMRKPFFVAILEENIYVVYTDHMDRDHISIANKFDYETRHEPAMISLTDLPEDFKLYHSALQSIGDNPCSQSHCSDMCLVNDKGGYTCACPAGKRLDQQLRTCLNDWSEPSLMIASNNRLIRVLPNAVGNISQEVHVTSPKSNITALAYDSSTRTIFYADKTIVNHANYWTISSLKLDDFLEVETLFHDVGFVADIAVDYISKNIYWTNSEKFVIEMARFDGSSRLVIIDETRDLDPRAVAVDVLQGKLYYSDCGTHPHIGICDLDGKKCIPEPVRSPLRCITDLFVDVRERRLYWTDSELGLVAVEETSTKQFSQLRYSPEPLGVVVMSHSLFWIDRHVGDILHQPMNDLVHEMKLKLGKDPIMAIVALDDFSQPEGSSRCSSENGGCSYICVPASKMDRKCICPPTHHLNADERNCDKNTDELVMPTPASVLDANAEGVVKRRRTTPATGSNYRGCKAGYCFNGGTCSYKQQQISCICKGVWAGPRCENAPEMEHSTRGLVIGIIVAFCFITVVIIIVVIFFKTQSPLRPREVFRFVRLKSTLLGYNEKDPTSETLIQTGREENIYEDMYNVLHDSDKNHSSILETETPSTQLICKIVQHFGAKSKMVHSQSLDSVQSACSAEKKIMNREFI